MGKLHKMTTLDQTAWDIAEKLPNFSEWVRNKLYEEAKLPKKEDVAIENVKKWDNAVQELGPVVKRWGEIKETAPAVAKEIFLASKKVFPHATLPFSLDVKRIRYCIRKYEELFPPSPPPAPTPTSNN
jgi:hypothetical protein